VFEGGTQPAQEASVQGIPTSVERVVVSRFHLTDKDREQAPVVFTIFLISQVLDALFTYGGVNRLGIDVEMNQLLANGMRMMGPGLTLTAAKLVACLCGFFLYSTARHRTLAVAAGLSIGVAIVPWCVVFFWVALKS
jgi:hypothetical protein